MICPICLQPVNGVTDEIIVKWNPDHNWWVLYHLKLTAPADPRYENEATYQLGDRDSKFRTYCGQARYNPKTGDFN